jgi:hypothetical protein
MPSHWKSGFKTCLSSWSYLTEVFEVADIAKVSTQYKTIAYKKELLLGVYARVQQ